MILGLILFVLGVLIGVGLIWLLVDLEAALVMLAAAVAVGLIVGGIVAMLVEVTV